MKKSPWMPIDTTPAHIGWYEIKGWPYSGDMQYWNGKHWGMWLDEKEKRKMWVYFPWLDTDKWRGKL